MSTADSNKFTPVARTIIVGGCMVLIILGLWLLSFFWNTAFLALVLTITLAPLVNWLRRKGWPAGLATVVTVLLLLLGALLVIFLLIHSVGELSDYLAQYSSSTSAVITDINNFLASLGINTNSAAFSLQDLSDSVLKIAAQALKKFGSMLSVIALAVVASMFMLFEAPNFGKRLSSRFGANQSSLGNLNRFVNATRDFIVITTLVGIVEGVIIAVALYLLGVPFPITWGMTFWLLNYIPYLGIWLAVIPPAFLASIELGSPYGLIVLLIYIVVSNVFKLLILPKVMGDKVDTSMTVGFLGIFFWGAVLGVFGVLLAYPYTLLVRDVFLARPEESWLAELMRKGGSAANPADHSLE